MAVRQYIGARYVPIFGRKDEESIEWDNTKPYEPLTVVLHNGASFTSRQYVPAGIDINNEEFWALTGNYNAQIEQYRQEVNTFDGRITTANENALQALEKSNGNEDKISMLATNTGVSDTVEEETPLSQRIANEITARENAVSAETLARENAVSAETLARETAIDEINADNWVTTNRINEHAVTYDKLSIDLQNRNSAIDMLTNIEAYVDNTNGDDATAKLGNRTKPFKTLDAAFKAADERGNNFRFNFLRSGSYTLTMRVMVGSVVHFFTENANGPVTVNIDNGAPLGGVFFYDTHLGCYGTAENPLTITAPQYIEIEGGTLWTSGRVIFDMAYLYLLDGSAQLAHCTMSRGYILGKFGNIIFDDLTINNREAHSAFEWSAGILRCQGTSMQIGRNPSGDNQIAILLRSCTANFNSYTGVVTANTDYQQFMHCYSGVTFAGDSLLTAFNGYGQTNSVISGIRIRDDAVIG